jgi:hypothetical protein
MDNEYIGVQRRGCGFVELWPLKPAIENCKNLRIFELLMIDSSLESTEKQKYAIEKFLASLLFELFVFEVRISA